MEYEAVIGLEVHAELNTRSKMFCSCPVVDPTTSEPNTAVCPVCAGMPGVLPVVNQKAVEYGIRVGLALECKVAQTSIFARKNYFYPDLPKGYQISQYEYPLAEGGRLAVNTSEGERVIRVRRVHLEEDTGKLTHLHPEGDQAHSLVDLNRAGVPLLEIVSEPDMHTLEEVRGYATELRAILRALGVNTGDMEKGAVRFEANVSVRPVGTTELGTRVEIKNLNSFRALERATAYQIEQQIKIIEAGGRIVQETLGWNETSETTYSQRSKEEAHDYRYFPEPDLPPLVVEQEWIDAIGASLPELPRARSLRFQQQYGLPVTDAELLVSEGVVADYFEAAAQAAQGKGIAARAVANWITGELFARLNQSGDSIQNVRVQPEDLAALLALTAEGQINLNTAKSVLGDMLASGKSAAAIIEEKGLRQISDSSAIQDMVRQSIEANPKEVAAYLAGKETLSQWFFGQVMRVAKGQANPQVVREELERQLQALKS